ncbi:MAG: hypothetical protein UW27_C0011G0014 [Parcubacteria group bacterium GW2011_GWA1_44_13]|uniref:Uncharacterized protein n=1 Tax=Candidatus Nomurabacteria bacterium GW2011_GWB1_44_12 TaxID=1618748 RepID=A0A837I6M2_9BACT|nr:MAG: hypothetical protein UW25_C0007G0014 [Candidatus Nomurabacteria bacterium GW2011_GWB1_44_12]KKT37692.1 MAG: hypothetical protein UW27_C0011G0014 [Parcubacteria group bacterium GW2011_GWA1_44_13]HBB44194.1 hypothetical protein [Candidatus Yonathbacteria bacterium]
MPNPEGVKFKAAKREERLTSLKDLTPGQVFRLPSVNYEEAVGGDDPGGCFYYVDVQPIKKEDDGLISVVSLDWKNKRKLPFDTKVHSHRVDIAFHPCPDV